MHGTAVDLVPTLTVAQVRALHRFNGIGWQGSGPLAGKVRHVDVGHTAGTNSDPITWTY